MRMLTGFIPPSEGVAEICGYDVEKHPLEARKRVGYLPENNPLYTDMYVREYLHFVAGLYGIQKPGKRVDELIQLTGLELEQKKHIGVLSKGYRQRVGLAQAMLHDPEVLILDEPTSGLDPNQLAEIRALIRQLGEKKTVLFSSHIMQEVQALCSRVLVINKGQLVADDSIEHLQNRLQGEMVVLVEFAEELSAERLRSIPKVRKVKALGGKRWQLSADAQTDLRVVVSQWAQREELTLLELHRESASVEDVFKKLTQG
jgi:ABC-2 type transport system ATP-binding protein